MNTPEIIRKIVSRRSKNEFEKKGVQRDLEIIVQKLEKGEYEKGFISVNKFDVVSRTEGLFREMEFLMQLGHDWENILRGLPLAKFHNIADLCPGYTPKIELGLYYLGFKGRISVIDIDSASIGSLARFINLFKPPFKITKRKENLFGKFKSSYDLVLGNHIVDDLVVCHFTDKSGIKLKDFYAQEEIALKVWKDILASKEKNISEVAEKIVGVLEKITKKSGIIFLSQYKSYTEKLFDLNEAYEFNREVFVKIKQILIDRGFASQDKMLSKIFLNYKGHFGIKDCILLKKYANKSKKDR